METLEVDVRGLSCPEPVLRVREEMARGCILMVLVDNATARDNVQRLAATRGWGVQTTQDGAAWRLHLTPTPQDSAVAGAARDA
jgi:tRNA 2-thiouridine synthesizing protein A